MATPASVAASPVTGATDAVTATVTVTTTVTEIAHTLVERQLGVDYYLSQLGTTVSRAADFLGTTVARAGNGVESALSYNSVAQRSQYSAYTSAMSSLGSQIDRLRVAVTDGGGPQGTGNATVIEGGVLIALVAIFGISFLIALGIIAARLGRLVQKSSTAAPPVTQMSQPIPANGQGYMTTPNMTTPKEYATTTAHDYSTTPLLAQQQSYSQPVPMQEHTPVHEHIPMQEHAHAPTANQQQFTTSASPPHQFHTTTSRE